MGRESGRAQKLQVHDSRRGIDPWQPRVPAAKTPPCRNPPSPHPPSSRLAPGGLAGWRTRLHTRPSPPASTMRQAGARLRLEGRQRDTRRYVSHLLNRGSAWLPDRVVRHGRSRSRPSAFSCAAANESAQSGSVADPASHPLVAAQNASASRCSGKAKSSRVEAAAKPALTADKKKEAICKKPATSKE